MTFGGPACPGWPGSALPHNVADKILNHQTGTISGVAAIYQRHQFLPERLAALDLWGAHIEQLLATFDLALVKSDGHPRPAKVSYLPVREERSSFDRSTPACANL